MTIEGILSRLARTRPSGTGWAACCPAHDDHTPSLSVTRGDNGAILLKCFAGCELKAIIAALGLSLSDLFAESSSPATAPDIVYDYRDERGELLFQVVRGLGKRFRQRRPDGTEGWLWNLSGVRRVLYRLPELMAADVRATVFVVEGENLGGQVKTGQLWTGQNRPVGAGTG